MLIKVDSFQVADNEASVQPNGSVVLGKNEALNMQLRVSEANAFGKRSGRLCFNYHDKPIEIPVLLREPPRIWLSFPDVPNVRESGDGILLRLPIDQAAIVCHVETD